MLLIVRKHVNDVPAQSCTNGACRSV